MTQDELIAAFDKIDTSDPECAHTEADMLLLAAIPLEVRKAYERVVSRSKWWASA